MNSWRAGSTLLATILGVHQGIITLIETRWFANVLPRLRGVAELDEGDRIDRMNEILLHAEHLGQLETPPPRQREIIAEHAARPEEILPALVDDFRKRTKPGASAWGEKSCLHSFYVHDIHRVFPGAKFIHLVRDPRATVHSIRKETFVGVSNDWCVAAHAYERFNRAIEEGLDDVPDDQKLLLHYEDLVIEPGETLRQCCHFLDMEFDAAMLSHERIVRGPQAPGSQTALSAVTTDFLSEWQRALGPEQVRCIDNLSRRLECTGRYNASTAPVSITKLAALSALLATKRVALRLLERIVERGRRRPFLFQSVQQHLSFRRGINSGRRSSSAPK